MITRRCSVPGKRKPATIWISSRKKEIIKFRTKKRNHKIPHEKSRRTTPLLFLLCRHPAYSACTSISSTAPGHCLLHPLRQNRGADFSGEFYLHLAADIFRRRLSGHLPGVDNFDSILFVLR